MEISLCCYIFTAVVAAIELFELTIIIELVRLSLLRYAGICSNYICGCNVDRSFVSSGVVICDDFSL